MMAKIRAVLWKIGSSLVVTVPAVLIKEIGLNEKEKGIFEVSVGKPQSFVFLARPWKCGGSHVVTIPTAYVDVYNLRRAVVDKIEYSMDMGPIKIKV